MKMDVIWARSPKIRIGHAVSRFGDDSLLLSSKKIGQRYRLIIGTDQEIKEKRNPKPLLSEPVKSAPEREKMDYQKISFLIKKEIEHLRKELESKALESDRAKSNLETMLKNLRIPSNLRSSIMARLSEDDANPTLTRKVKKILKDTLPESTEIDLSVKTHILCGNYGSGKTTIAIKMILKLMSLNQAVPILVSYKQQQSTSQSLMKELSKELEVPIFDINDIATLQKVEDQLTDNGVMIVDTSTGNIKEEIPEMEKALHSVNFHLVNACDSFVAAQEHFLNVTNWSSIIITRLEMNSNRWPLIQSLANAKIPLSLGSISPDLNSQLVSVTKEDLIDQLDLPNSVEFDQFKAKLAGKAA